RVSALSEEILVNERGFSHLPVIRSYFYKKWCAGWACHRAKIRSYIQAQLINTFLKTAMRLESTDDISQLHPGGEIGRDQSAVGDFLYPYDGILCFGGEDWWYHNQAHFDMQIMRCMARRLPVLYVNSLGFGMPRLAERAQFFKKIGRKLRSVAHPTRSPF